MADSIATGYKYIVKTPGIAGGEARIDGTRISVTIIVNLVKQGASVEEIVAGYSHVPLSHAQIHAALAYYYDHRAEIDKLLAEWDEAAQEGLAGEDDTS